MSNDKQRLKRTYVTAFVAAVLGVTTTPVPVSTASEIDVVELTVEDAHAALASHRYTARQLAEASLVRIAAGMRSGRSSSAKRERKSPMPRFTYNDIVSLRDSGLGDCRHWIRDPWWVVIVNGGIPRACRRARS